MHFPGNAGYHDARTNPGEKMAQVHSEGRIETVVPFFCIPEEGHIREADVHRQVTKPGKKHYMPQSELLLALCGNAIPDFGLGN